MDEDEIKNDAEQTKLQTTTKNELDKYLNESTQEKVVGNFMVDPETGVKKEVITSKAVDVSKPSNPLLNQTLKNPDNTIPEAPQVKSIIRTYKSDMEDTIRSQHISSLNIAVAENNKMMRKLTEESQIEEKKADRDYKIFIIITILIIAGVLAFLIPYFMVKNQNPTEQEVEIPINNSLIVADTVEKINLDSLNKDRIAKTLEERVEQISILVGSIRQFYLVEGAGASSTSITSKRFLELIKARVPDGILRTIKDPYMFGMHGIQGNQKFLILKVGSYETTYAGMLSWENGMWYDFTELFGLNSESELDTNGKPILGEKVAKFQDVVIKNKDTRAVKDDDGRIVFLYSLVDKNTVVVTTSADTFREIMNRMDKMSVVR